MNASTNPARAALDATMDEKTFRYAIQQQLTTHKWRWTYIPDSRQVQGHPGIPDILATRDGRFLAIELKTERGKIRDTQLDWLDDLARCPGVETYLWRPSDMPRIEHILA